MRVDLHIHTTASDGCWTPEEVVAHVRAAGIGLFAIADHDTLAHVRPTADLACQAGLAFLPATEVSSLTDGTGVHILAYGVDPADTALNRLLEANTTRLNWVNEETLRRLVRAGYPVDMDAYITYQYDRSRGGWKALNFLIDSRLCQDVHDFVDRIFVRDIRPPWPDFPHPAEVVDTIRAAGGLPVLAHPGMSLRRQGVSEKSLAPFLEFGIAGLECYTHYHDPATTQTCLAFCARHDLLVTGGSDCHGGFAGRHLGIPPVELEDLRLGPLAESIVRRGRQSTCMIEQPHWVRPAQVEEHDGHPARPGAAELGPPADPDHTRFNYGGQAVVEGVMMRGVRCMAVAVRDPAGEIVVRTEPLNTALYRGPMSRLPLLRGLTLLWDALGLGMKALMWSADVAVGESSDAFQGTLGWATGLVGLAVGVGLFMALPSLLVNLLPVPLSPLLDNLLEGLVRLGLVVAYIWAVGRMPDVARVFAYHGAEHKTINAYECGVTLTVEAVQAHSTAHARCGTAFLLTVVVVSILVLAPLGQPSLLWRVISRVLALPLIAGLAYEWIRLSGRYADRRWMRVLAAPSMALQRLTTREPEDGMVEVAIRALEAVLEGEQADLDS